MALQNLPDQEALVAALSVEGAPPWLMLDLDGSEIDGDGIVYVALVDGELVEVEP